MTSNKVPFTDEKQDPQDLPATLRVRFTSPIRILLPLVGIMHVKLILDYLPLKLDYIFFKLFRCVILSRVINCERIQEHNGLYSTRHVVSRLEVC